MERSSPVRNRMLEIGASGSVGGEGGNILVYPAGLIRDRQGTPVRLMKAKAER